MDCIEITVPSSSSKPEIYKQHLWKEVPAPSPEEEVLEQELHWPPKTLRILREALEKKLPRGLQWDLSQVKDKAPYWTAETYYKRGSFDRPQDLEEYRYTIQIQKHFCEDFLSLLNKHFVLCDKNVHKYWHAELPLKTDLLLEGGEENKNFQALSKLCKALRQSHYEKVLIVGGGALCDLGAFASKICRKKFILVPTTLLSMVDASVGGKSGINVPPYGKNLVGAFAFPEKVFICSDWLKTLSREEFYSGAAECMKHAILKQDRKLLRVLSEACEKRDLLQILLHLKELIEVKAQIVQRDPYEKGERALLNLGHTFAHALEAISQESSKKTNIRHGHAVAIGLFIELELAYRLGLQDQNYVFEVQKLLLKSQCLLSRKDLQSHFSSSINSETFLTKMTDYMKQDKKAENSDEIPFVFQKNASEFIKKTFSPYEIQKLWKEFESTQLPA